MLDDYLNSTVNDLDAFSELGADELDEWDSLKELLADLDDREREPVPTGRFEVPALLGDADGIARWSLRLSQVRRLSAVPLLRQGLPRAPWCIAVRVTAIDSDAIHLGVTTTRRVSQEQLAAFVAQLVERTGDPTIEIEPVVHRSSGERWLTIDEVARELRVKPRDVERWIEAGLLVTRQVETDGSAERRIRLRPERRAVGV